MINIYKVADAIEQIANEVHLFAAAAGVATMQPHQAAEVLDSIDIINATGILAAMEPHKAAAIVAMACPLWAELIFEDMGEPWEDAIKACLLV